jgi:hypothetical protein
MTSRPNDLLHCDRKLRRLHGSFGIVYCLLGLLVYIGRPERFRIVW